MRRTERERERGKKSCKHSNTHTMKPCSTLNTHWNQRCEWKEKRVENDYIVSLCHMSGCVCCKSLNKPHGFRANNIVASRKKSSSTIMQKNEKKTPEWEIDGKTASLNLHLKCCSHFWRIVYISTIQCGQFCSSTFFRLGKEYVILMELI